MQCAARSASNKQWRIHYAVGFSMKMPGEYLAKGYLKRPDGGWDFARNWLEGNSYL
jgi:hypothetical protein